MKKIEFESNWSKWLVVDLPKDVVSVQESFCDAILTTHHDGYIETYYPLEDNEDCELKLICKLSEATEEQAKCVVVNHYWDNGEYYKDYNRICSIHRYCYTAIESLHSLLTSKGIDIHDGNWYLFNKI